MNERLEAEEPDYDRMERQSLRRVLEDFSRDLKKGSDSGLNSIWRLEDPERTSDAIDFLLDIDTDYQDMVTNFEKLERILKLYRDETIKNGIEIDEEAIE